MIRKDKVVWMTRLAIEEKNDTRYAFITEHFWFNDYATKELWEAFFAITFAYALAVVLGLVAFGDGWTVTYHIADCIALGERLLYVYLVLLVLGLLTCLLAHVWLYREAYRKRQTVEKYLRRLNRLYEAEERLKEASK